MTAVTIEATRQSYQMLQEWGDCVNRTLINLDYSRGGSRFAGSYQYAQTSDCVAARLSGTAHRTSRSMRKLREVENDFVLLVYLKSGQAAVSHQHYDSLVSEGSFITFDSSRPHDLAMDGQFDHLVLRLPRGRFISLHPASSCILNRPIEDTSEETQAAADILGMIISLGSAKPSTISTMSEAVVKLLGDRCLREAGAETGPAVRHRVLARRVMKCLDENFADPDYTATRLAAAIGISRRYVDSLFAEINSSFGKAVLEKRLERCHILLNDPRMLGRSVSEIAFESGFNNLSHFSTRFRERFGIAPREVRNSILLSMRR